MIQARAKNGGEKKKMIKECHKVISCGKKETVLGMLEFSRLGREDNYEENCSIEESGDLEQEKRKFLNMGKT